MAGRQAGPTICAGVSRMLENVPPEIAFRARTAQKLSPRQTAQHRLLELSGGSSCGLFSTMHVIAEHPRHHAIATEEVDLKAMCLLLSARFVSKMSSSIEDWNVFVVA